MKTFFLLSMSAAILFLASCQSMHNNKVSEDFDRGTRNYIKMVRWNELDQAPLTFVDDTLRAEFEKRVKAAKDVKISDYRVKYTECKPEKGEGELLVEWDYYIPPSIRLKTVVDSQKWRYVEEEERKGWMLMTLFPEFK